MSLLSNPSFLKALASFTTITIALVAGAALSMYFFSIPIIQQAPVTSTSSATMLHQFHHLITLGGRYLQTSSQIQAMLLLVLTCLLYRHPDQELASRWKFFAAALGTYAQVAWYEVVFVFPTNDRLVEMEGELAGVAQGDREKADRVVRDEVLRLMEKWRKWHVGRIVLPLGAVVFVMCGLMS